MKVLTQILVCTSLYLQVLSQQNQQNQQIQQKVLFPPGNNWKYSYNGFVSAGSVVGEEAISRFDLNAELQIKSNNGLIIGQLSKITSSLYNGPLNEIPDDEHPTDLEDKVSALLSLPFIINYNGTNIESIGLLQYDPLWSVNIKRGIASLLQLQLDNLEKAASLISEENLYGTCNNIEYSIKNETNKILITKTIDHTQCQNYPMHSWSSLPKFTSPSTKAESPKISNTIRQYTLVKEQIEEIESKRRFYSQPFNAQGEAQQSYQYQHLKLLSVEKYATEIESTENIKNKSLSYEINIGNLNQDRFINETNNQLGYMGAINTLLNDVVSNLDEKHLDKDILDFHRELMFLYYNFFCITTENFHKFYEEYSRGTSFQQETKLSIFFELLPQVGSENSVNFMKDLILKKKLKDITMIKMLSIFPLYVKEHSEKLLVDLEVLLTLNHKYDETIREAAVLSFATLVYQTYVAGKCSSEVFENYALKYFNLFAESEGYGKKMLYLQGLDNLQLGSVPTYLKSISKNMNYSRHLRFLAAWSAVNSAQLSQQKVYETYWPIFTNTSECLEVRIGAMLNLLYGQPTKSRLMTLYWYIKGEEDANPHLYNFFYTTVVSLYKSSYPCFQQLSSIAQHLIRYLPAPKTKKWMSGNYIFDYSDTEKDFGALVHLTLIGNPKTDNPNIIYLNVKNYASNLNMNQIAIYLKLEGVSNQLSEVLSKVPLELENLDKVVKILNLFNLKPIDGEEIHIEVIVKVHDKSVFCTHINGYAFQELKKILKNVKLLTEYQLNHQSIVVPYTREFMEPTDLGTLLIKSVVSNSIASTRGSLVSDTKDSKHAYTSDVDFRYYTYTISFLELYNPLSDMWHGVERGKKLQAKFLINGTLTVENEGSQIELTESRNGDEYVNLLLHSHSYTYLISNGSTALQHHCPKCKNIYNITQGPVKDKIQLLDKQLDHNETRLQVTMFDCDSYQEVKDIFHKLHSNHRGNAEITPLAKPLLYLMHYSDYVSYIPCQGRCGVSLIIKPTRNEYTELNYKFSIKNLTKENNLNLMYVLSSQMRTMSTPTDLLLDIWNATALLKWEADKNSVTLLVTIDADELEEDGVCVSTGYNTEELLSDNNLDENSIITNVIVKFGQNTEDVKQPVCMAVETAVNNFLYKIIKLLNEKMLKNA